MTCLVVLRWRVALNRRGVAARAGRPTARWCLPRRDAVPAALLLMLLRRVDRRAVKQLVCVVPLVRGLVNSARPGAAGAHLVKQGGGGVGWLAPNHCQRQLLLDQPSLAGS